MRLCQNINSGWTIGWDEISSIQSRCEMNSTPRSLRLKLKSKQSIILITEQI